MIAGQNPFSSRAELVQRNSNLRHSSVRVPHLRQLTPSHRRTTPKRPTLRGPAHPTLCSAPTWASVSREMNQLFTHAHHHHPSRVG